MLALERLETVDERAAKMGISLVKVNDLELFEEYGLTSTPSLVYFRRQAPVTYEGQLNDAEAVLNWLVANRATGDEEDVIEEVSAEALETMVSTVDNLAVLFCKKSNMAGSVAQCWLLSLSIIIDDTESRKADQLLETLERIDDECDQKGVTFVKVSDGKAAEAWGVDQQRRPQLVFFDKEVPDVYQGECSVARGMSHVIW